jgi:hypothetical protein
MWLGWNSLDRKELRDRISRITENDFEQFICELIRAEAARRVGALDPTGFTWPAPSAVPDGGVDIGSNGWRSGPLVALDGAPFSWLGHDGKVAVSCKAPQRAGTSGIQKKFVEDAKKKTSKIPGRLQDGFAVFLVSNHDLTLDPKTRTKTRGKRSTTKKAPKKPVKSGATKAPTEGENGKQWIKRSFIEALFADEKDRAKYTAQVTVLSSDDLADWLLEVRPSLDDNHSKLLGLRRLPPFVLTNEEIGTDLASNRGGPGFVEDPGQTAIQSAVQSLLSLDSPVLWIRGPAGVGKTRVVVDTLADHTRRADVVWTTNSADAFAALDSSLLESAPALVLVADDVHDAGDAQDIAERFSKQKQRVAATQARLIIISPIYNRLVRAGQTSPRWAVNADLPVLEEDTISKIAEDALGAAHPRVKDVVRLSEGFPWFARLLAEELKLDTGATDALGIDQATRLVVAGSQRGEVDVRLLALLFIVLHQDQSWDSATPNRLEVFISACPSPFTKEQVTSARLACEERGLVRVSVDGSRRYVTPWILQREVLRATLLNPPDPDGPKRTRALSKTFSAEFSLLLDRARSLGFSPGELGALGRSVAEAVIERPFDEVLGSPSLRSIALFAGEHAPGAIGRWFARGATEIAGDRWRLTAAHAWLAWMLETLLERDDSHAQWSMLEPTMFALALEEASSQSANAQIAEQWSRSYLHARGEPVDHARRLAALDARLRVGSSVERAWTIARCARLLYPEHSVLSPAPLSRDERAAVESTIWSALVDAMSSDDALVSRAAIDAFVRLSKRPHELRDAKVDHGRLSLALAALGDADRAIIRRDVLQRGESFRSWAGDAMFALIDRATAPRGFEQRLRDELVRYSGNATEVDASVIEAALEGEPPAILSSLAVLREPRLPARAAVILALGQKDEAAKLLAPLVDALSDAPLLFAEYVLGQHMAGRVERALRWIDDWSERDSTAVLAVACWIALSRVERFPFERVAAIVARGALPETALDWFGRIGTEHPSTEDARTLLRAIDGRFGESSMAALAIGPLLCRVEKPSDALLDEALVSLTRSMAGKLTQHGWWLAAKLLCWACENGRAEAALGLALDAVARDDQSLYEIDRSVWFTAEKHREALGRALFDRLERGSDALIDRVRSIDALALVEAIPVESALRWAGDDLARANRLASLFALREQALPPLARALIVRFGARSLPAQTLAERAKYQFEAGDSFEAREAARIAHAERWANDSEPAVREWANELAETFAQRAGVPRVRPTGT